MEWLVSADTNLDGVVDPADDIDEYHYTYLVDYCDYSGDMIVEYCEI